MKNRSLATGLLVLAFGGVTIGSCGGDDSTPASDGGVVADGGTVADGGSTVDAASSGCRPTGGLPMQADGKVVIEATYTGATGGFNGATTAFTTAFGAASTGNWVAQDQVPSTSDATIRGIQFTFSPAPATACQSFPVTAAPALTALTITEGGPVTGNAKKWLCEGTVVVDTVSGKSNTFHFDGLVCKTFAFVNNHAMGSVTLTGKGSATDIR